MSLAPARRLTTEGRIERGAVVRLVVREGLAAADSTVSAVSVSPAAAGTVTANTIRLLQAGPITISARAADGRQLSVQLDVATPPTVFFDGVTPGNRDIYSVALDGGDAKRWTTSAGDDSHPTVAGGTLLFSSTRDGNGELYSLSLAAGSTERRLTTTAANETQPVLSAAGTNVAFASDAPGVPRINVASVALTGPARLTAASFGFGGSIESNASWSPAGDRLALMSTTNGRANLFLVAATAGATPTAVPGSNSLQTDVEPAWSPSGNLIAFASTRGGGTGLFLLDLRTNAITAVPGVPPNSGQPAWLPDGRLLFTSSTSTGSSLWWIDPTGPAGAVEIPVAVTRPGHPTAQR
jgi:TolB protein